MACLFTAYLFHLVSAITSDSTSISSVFYFLITPQQTRSSGASFLNSKHTNRFVLLIESICFWIAANERAIRSDNTSEETAVRRWVTTTSAIKDQQSLKEGITSFLCRPAVAPYGAAASLSCFLKHPAWLITADGWGLWRRVRFVCGPGIIAVFTCWTEKLACSWLFTPAWRRQMSPAAVLSVQMNIVVILLGSHLRRQLQDPPSFLS